MTKKLPVNNKQKPTIRMKEGRKESTQEITITK